MSGGFAIVRACVVVDGWVHGWGSRSSPDMTLRLTYSPPPQFHFGEIERVDTRRKYSKVKIRTVKVSTPS